MLKVFILVSYKIKLRPNEWKARYEVSKVLFKTWNRHDKFAFFKVPSN